MTPGSPPSPKGDWGPPGGAADAGEPAEGDELLASRGCSPRADDGVEEEPDEAPDLPDEAPPLLPRSAPSGRTTFRLPSEPIQLVQQRMGPEQVLKHPPGRKETKS